MKVTGIELLNKIASGELEDGTHIRNIEHDCEYIYHKKDCRFEFVKKGIWEDYFYKFNISELNDEIEIIEESKEEFEDIKPLEQIVMKKPFYKDANDFYKDANDLAKDVSISFEKIDDIVISINDLIKNQKQIIRELKVNKENDYNDSSFILNTVRQLKGGKG